jgi:predicted AAA+ superfamily ATPase
VYERYLRPTFEAALKTSPVTFLSGGRQVGKSTLVQTVLPQYQYLTFDNMEILASAKRDPKVFIQGLNQVILDEVQLLPELARVIKLEVDNKRTPGRFVLTGSASLLTLPQLADALVGRLSVLTLYPLSQGEILGRPEGFVDWLFANNSVNVQKLSLAPIVDYCLRGGFPEIVDASPEVRNLWHHNYVNTLLVRDVRDYANIRGLAELPNVIHMLAARNATLLNVAELSRTLAMPHTTLSNYLDMLEALFLIRRVPAWSSSLGKRLVKTPKLYLLDSGLAASLLNLEAERLHREPTLFGALLENFVMMELYKQLSWSQTRARLYHFRSHTGQEVDTVLEGPAGDIAGIEIKNKASVGVKDFKGLEALKELTGKKFKRGVLLYMGDTLLPFGDNLWAVPLSSLWELHP